MAERDAVDLGGFRGFRGIPEEGTKVMRVRLLGRIRGGMGKDYNFCVDTILWIVRYV